MTDYIDTVFGSGGLLAQRFAGYAPRPGQIAMARAVDAAIRDGTHLMVEAPTGTGKSVAYSVPCSYHAVHDGRRVVIATVNNCLLEQLVTKDLPLLADLLPWDFTFALLKGRNNFLCQDRLYQEEAEGTLWSVADPADWGALEELLAWSETTDTGDRSELPFEPPQRLWRRFSATSDDCKGSDCRFREDCYWQRARALAGAAQVVITNHSLLLAHLKVREATGNDLVLPAFDVAVLDEAHKAADIARDFFGYQVTAGAVRWATKLLKRIGDAKLHNAISDEAGAFFSGLAAHRRSPAYRARLRRPNTVPHWRLTQLLGSASELFSQVGADTPDAELRAEVRRAGRRAQELAEQVDSAISLADPGAVSFIEEDLRGNAILRSKPIAVADRLRTSLFERTHSVVLTSATLTTGGSFDHIAAEVGVPEPRLLEVESPFDVEERVLLIVPEEMPPPTHPSYPEAVAEAVAEILELADGRTLGLFTSYRNLNAAYERVRGNGHRVLRQGDMPRTALIEEFRRDVRSVLLGTESFWAGVDVPGEALSCVVIDRLPFPSPDDPVLDAISERDRQWFHHYSLPRAVIAFKQGFGRLIRTASDYGVVVLLDQRIVTKSYGRLFVSSLPNVLKSRRLENVRHFLAEVA